MRYQKLYLKFYNNFILNFIYFSKSSILFSEKYKLHFKIEKNEESDSFLSSGLFLLTPFSMLHYLELHLG